jgi:hypothetical protein
MKAVSLLSSTQILGLDKVFSWFRSAKPVTGGVKEIFAIKDYNSMFQLHWHNPIPIIDAGPPKYSTWKEFTIKTCGDDFVELTEEEAKAVWRLYHMDTVGPVLNYLEREVDLNEELSNKFMFCSVPAPCTGFVGVLVKDEETLEKLEKELKLVGINWRFTVIQHWDELKFTFPDEDMYDKKREHTMKGQIVDMLGIVHPWQPDWVITSEDVDTYLKELDATRPALAVIQRRDWYPPYLVYVTSEENGEEMVHFLMSNWYGMYDPVCMTITINGN